MMVLFFGNLVDITQQSELAWPFIHNTMQLQQVLYEQYPALQTAQYVMAVNGKMIQTNTILQEGDTIAFMPPFSGG
ncbi:MAG: MoaD/ThiS family protein [Bacteroidota bacterium]|jgi:molybdopterin converting factor small subunit|nr:MoaD/ThiS family protein [Bacteroidota bacterium]